MKKKIKLDNQNQLILQIDQGYACPVIMISEAYIKDNNVEKEYVLSIWDDIEFSAYNDNLKLTTIEFELDIKHPLYFCFNRFLDNDEEFIVDDDHTYGNLEKYVVFKRDDKNFKMIFVNNTNERRLYDNQFGAFIKNIGPDSRSKIHDQKTKIRIIDFFRDMERVLQEEYHQITFDEYIEMLDQSNELVPVLRKTKR